MARLPVVGADRDNWGGILNEYLGIEHGDGGYHNISYGNTASRTADPEDGQIYINDQTYHLEQYVSAAWTQIASLIPVGTKMIFYQGSAPTGWTKDTADDDKALRVVSGTGGVTSGTNSFSSILTSEVTSDTESTHEHETATMAETVFGAVASLEVDTAWPHGTSGTSRTASRVARTDGLSKETYDSGPGDAHSHTETFDIDYMDVIICSKD